MRGRAKKGGKYDGKSYEKLNMVVGKC